MEQKDRHSNMVHSSVRAPPKKDGAGGSYTWGAATSVTDYAPVGIPQGMQIGVQTRMVQQAPQVILQQGPAPVVNTTSYPTLGAGQPVQQRVVSGNPSFARVAAQAPVRYAAAPVAAPMPVTYSTGPATTIRAATSHPASPTKVYAAAAPAPWTMRLGAVMPNFKCETTHGNFSFHEFLDSDSSLPWTVLFSHPKDFTPVCTTEIGRCQVLNEHFNVRGVKLIGVSCDPVEEHLAWGKDVLHREQIAAEGLSFPIIADNSKQIVVQLGMLDPDEIDNKGLPLPARALIVIGPDKKVKLSILYPATTGRNFDEILRVIDSVQLTAGQGLATPVDWKQGERVIVGPGMPTEEARQKFTNLVIEDLPSGKQYLRSVDCPAASSG